MGPRRTFPHHQVHYKRWDRRRSIPRHPPRYPRHFVTPSLAITSHH